MSEKREKQCALPAATRVGIKGAKPFCSLKNPFEKKAKDT
jgi:hypothetical protein